MGIGLIISSRLGSERAPSKALFDFFGVPMLGFLLERLRISQQPNRFVLASSTLEENQILSVLAKQNGYEFFQGSDSDLIERYLCVAHKYNLDILVRVTGDCPFVNSNLVDFVINNSAPLLRGGEVDITTTKSAFPMGLDVECFSTVALERLNNLDNLSEEEREHLTLGFYDERREFVKTVISPIKLKECKTIFTVDTFEDYIQVMAKKDFLKRTDSLIKFLTHRVNGE